MALEPGAAVRPLKSWLAAIMPQIMGIANIGRLRATAYKATVLAGSL